LAAASAA
jgi:hypothetical protein